MINAEMFLFKCRQRPLALEYFPYGNNLSHFIICCERLETHSKDCVSVLFIQ